MQLLDDRDRPPDPIAALIPVRLEIKMYFQNCRIAIVGKRVEWACPGKMRLEKDVPCAPGQNFSGADRVRHQSTASVH